MPNLIPKGAPNGVLPRSEYQHLGHCESQALPSSQGFLTTAAGLFVKWAGFITHIWWETLKNTLFSSRFFPIHSMFGGVA
jgi:hypothetical protein